MVDREDAAPGNGNLRQAAILFANKVVSRKRRLLRHRPKGFVCIGALAMAIGAVAGYQRWAARVEACGPDFPSAMVFADRSDFLSVPAADYASELHRVLTEYVKDLPPDNRVWARQTPHDPNRGSSREVNEKHIRQAMQALGKSPVVVEQALDAIRAMQAKGKALASRSSASWRRGGSDGQASELDVETQAQVAWGEMLAAIKPVAALVPEPYLSCTVGATLKQSDFPKQAQAALQHLMQLPDEQKRPRAVWGAYLLGSLLRDSQPEQAKKWLRLCQQLAEQGMPDPLGLAKDAEGWLAYIEYHDGQFVEAMHRYVGTFHQNGHVPTVSLLWVTRDALHASQTREKQTGPNDPGGWEPVGQTRDANALNALAKDPLAQQLVSVYLLGRGGNPTMGPVLPPNDLGRSWLKQAEAADAKNVFGADRYAWLAYGHGQFDQARRWLKRADPSQPFVIWLSGKLALQQGDLKQALKHFEALVAEPLVDAKWPDVQAGRWFDEPVVGPRRVWSEIGAVRLRLGDDLGAWHAFVQAGAWLDAAVVAEQVLPVDTLKALVEQELPKPDANMESPGWYDAWSGANMANAMHGLLARKLTRMGRWQEARPHFLPEQQLQLDAYIQAIRAGHNQNLGKRERAQHFFEAAEMAREHGQRLLGSELGPDQVWVGGSFEWPDRWAADGRNWVLGETDSDSRKRLLAAVDQQRPMPDKRFHYRYTAADHAWEAAKLLPNNDETLAFVLIEAGGWLKHQDPKAADRFYKALVRRNPSLPVAQAADQARWFPKDNPLRPRW